MPSDIVRSETVPATMAVEGFASDAALLMADGTPAGPAKTSSLSSVLRFKWTILAVFAAVAAGAVAAIWVLIAPEYQAKAEVRVRPFIPWLVFKTEDSGMIPLYQSFTNTQVSIMRSPTVLQRALDQKDVQQTAWYKDPPRPLLREPGIPMERLREELSVRPRNKTEIIDVVFSALRPSDAAVVVNAVLDQYIRHISEISDETRDQLYRQLAEQFKSLQNEIAGREKILAKLRKDLGTGAPEELVAAKRIRLDQTEARLGKALREISVLELHKKELGRIRYGQDISRRQMERLRYVRGVSGMSESTRRHLRTQLEKELIALETQVCEAEDALAGLIEESRGADPNAPDPKRKLRIDETEERVGILKREIADIQWRRKELAKLMDGSPEKKPAATTRPWMPPAYHTDLEWRRLDVAARTARSRMEAMRKRLRDTHPAVIGLAGEIELAEKLRELRETQLDGEWRKDPAPVLGRARDDAGAQAGESHPQGAAAARPDYETELKSVELQLSLLKHQEELLRDEVKKERKEFDEIFANAQMLEKENQAIQHKRQLFQAVRERLDQKEMERNVPGSIEVLTRAVVPSRPSTDRRAIFTVLALIGALGAAVGVAFLRANRNEVIYAARDLPGPVRAPFLGQVPLVRKAQRPALEEDPIVAESIRMIRTALIPRLDGRCSAVLISSADTGTGKSTVAAMLARNLADCGKRVLLIDADLRRRSLSARFGLADEPGLVDSLTSMIGDDRTIFDTGTPRLSVMPAGTCGDGTEIEATANGAFTACLNRLRPKYDIILLDSSPILPVADARILSAQADGTILVVRQDRCRRADVIDALACLGSSGGKLLGTVFIGSVGRENYQRDYPYYRRAEK